ncbi:28293_t:CDS:1, partial [Dentiscutata erythropus]
FIKIALPNYGKGFVKGMRNSESLEKNGIEFCKYIFKLEREEFEKNFETINFTKEKVNNIVDH